ncbi:MAG: hypothetical protein WEB03_16320 [Nitriliruptor sp.]|uniref:hypothetical protein n=1 Tax=Nitriliruptor sp. TaxID=2448056 RepID=UPI0034A03911
MTTRTRTTTMNPVRLLLTLTAMTALIVVLALASPAAAQFVDQGPSDTDTAAADDQVDDQGTSEQETAPVGGVDAGFGGAAIEDGAGLGAPHAAAFALLILALVGHLANARRLAPVRA